MGAKINNSELIQAIVENTSIQTSADTIPHEVSEKVVLTCDVSPHRNRIAMTRSGGSGTTGSITIYTTPSDYDFYITEVLLSFTKDATCDIASGDISMSGTFGEDGQARTLIALPVLTTTAERDTAVISTTYPLRMKRATAITIDGTFSVGSLRRRGIIRGFFVKTNVASV